MISIKCQLSQSWGGDKLTKKFMKILSIVLLTTVFFTSIIGTVQAKGKGLTIDTYTITPFVDPSTLTNMEPVIDGESKFVCDGTIRINHGTIRKFDYEGPLGTGTLHLKTLVSISQEAIPYEQLIETGKGVYQYSLVINNGPYGTGTLKGIGKLEWDYNLPSFKYEMWGNAKMVRVKGDLDIKWVSIEVYQFLFDTWWTTTTVVS